VVLDCKIDYQSCSSIDDTIARVQILLTYLKISFCVSDGRSKIVNFFFSEPCTRLGSAGEGEERSLAVAMAGVLSLFELNGSSPMISSVRSQTSSPSGFVRGVECFLREVFPGRAGMVSSLRAGVTNCVFGWSIGYRVGCTGNGRGN
jgi:hypothetical protein